MSKVCVTHVCVDLEVLDGASEADAYLVVDTMAEALVGAGGVPVAPAQLSGRAAFVGGFAEASVAVEAAIVGLWEAQKAHGELQLKVRIGVHTGDDSSLSVALAVLATANGNQIVVSGATDAAAGGAFEARSMGSASVVAEAEPLALWIVTDSRPGVDRRPLRLPD
jgi:class 3 adenylate cyclase